MAERTCSIPGCDRKHSGRGWCAKHLARWKSNGDPLVVRRIAKHPTEAIRRARVAEAKTAWRLRNPEKMTAARRRWKKEHPDEVRASRRKVKRRHPLPNRASVRARRARLRALTVVPFTAEQLRQRFAYFGDRCWMCGTTEDLTIDHVKPLSKGGAHMLCNLRPACASCNAKKGTKWPHAHQPDESPLHHRSLAGR